MPRGSATGSFTFAPRRLRFVAGAGIILLQVLIALTGNYAFFNLLTIALCVLLFDDAFLKRFLPSKIKDSIDVRQLTNRLTHKALYKRIGLAILALIILFLGLIQLGTVVIGSQNLPIVFRQAFLWVSPFRVVNNYGLFRVMTTSRPEIIIEGSNDGENWLEYEFKYKPGDRKRPLPWVAPHQPRLDWQMWFAALGNSQNNPWFVNLVVRILQGSPDVLRLFEKNPFPSAPPRYLRAELYEYRFTNFDTKRTTGDWWQRELIGTYFYPISLNGD